MLRKLTDAQTDGPVYINTAFIVAVDAPTRPGEAKARVWMQGIEQPAMVKETPEEVFSACVVMNSNGSLTF